MREEGGRECQRVVWLVREGGTIILKWRGWISCVSEIAWVRGKIGLMGPVGDWAVKGGD